MGWDEIDFEKIVAGATTVDVNSEQNFNFVLNSFGIALDERLNVTISATDSLPTLPGIRFFVDGEIRSSNTFMNKYRKLLDEYFDLWNDFEWYSRDSLTDPLNAANFLLDDTDLEAAMGENAYDLLINRADRNRVELWSADLLNGLYELYKLTQVHKRGLSRLNDYTSVKYNSPVFFNNADLRLGLGGTGNGNPYGDALGDYNSNKAVLVQVVGVVPVITRWIQDIDGSGGSWSIATGSRDTHTVTIKCLDLSANNISLDIVGFGAELKANYKKDNNGVTTVISAYTENYLKVGPNDTPIFVEVTAKDITLDPTLGLRYEFYEYGSPSNQAFPDFVNPSDTGSGSVKFDVLFDIHQSRNFLIDVNNSALEFFIEEE
jgi:hypothetical protein